MHKKTANVSLLGGQVDVSHVFLFHKGFKI